MRTDVNMERLMESLHRTGDIGKTENGGITRPGFSREYEMASKELIAMMKEAGLTVSKDRWAILSDAEREAGAGLCRL